MTLKAVQPYARTVADEALAKIDVEFSRLARNCQ
jgi:hypothetical protein